MRRVVVAVFVGMLGALVWAPAPSSAATGYVAYVGCSTTGNALHRRAAGSRSRGTVRQQNHDGIARQSPCPLVRRRCRSRRLELHHGTPAGTGNSAGDDPADDDSARNHACADHAFTVNSGASPSAPDSRTQEGRRAEPSLPQGQAERQSLGGAVQQGKVIEAALDDPALAEEGPRRRR